MLSWLPWLLFWPQTNPEALLHLKACSESVQRNQAQQAVKDCMQAVGIDARSGVDAHRLHAILDGLLSLVALHALRAGFQVEQRLGVCLGPEKQPRQPGQHTLIMPVPMFSCAA